MNPIEITKNLSDLKKCNRIYNIVAKVYVLSCGFYILADAFLFIISMNGDLFYLLLNGPVFKGAVLAAGYLGTYKKSNLIAVIAPVIMLFNTLLLWNADNYFDKFVSGILDIKINAVYLIMSIILAVMTILANSKYHFLEKQEGFPQFNEVFEQQKTGKPVYGLTFEERAERLRKNARDDMEELSLETPMYLESRSSSGHGKMDEI